MTISIEPVDRISDKPALEALLVSYYDIMTRKLAHAGGPDISVDTIMSDLWDSMDAFLPPNGAVFLAHDERDALVGCGFLKKIRPDAAELKRLFVSPAAQGRGLGRKLVEARINAACEMGITALYADTVKGNTEMLSLYAKLGFSHIERYPENANPAEWDEWLVYLCLELDPDG